LSAISSMAEWEFELRVCGCSVVNQQLDSQPPIIFLSVANGESAVHGLRFVRSGN